MSGSEAVRLKVEVDEKEALSDFGKLEKKSSKAFRSFEKDSKKATKSAQRFNKALGGIKGQIAGLVGGVGIAATLKKSVSLWYEQERAVAKVAGSLKAAGTYSATLHRHVQAWASELQKVTIYGDEAILQSFAMAKNMGANVELAKEFVKAGAEFSAMFPQGLETSVRQMAVSLGGSAGELGEKFPAVRAMSPEQLRSGEVAKFILREFSGNAAIQANTDSGRLQQAMNDLGDSMQVLGSELAPAATLMARAAAEMAKAAAGKDAWYVSVLKGIGAIPSQHPGLADPTGAPGNLTLPPREVARIRRVEQRQGLNKYLSRSGLPQFGMNISTEDVQMMSNLSGGIGPGELQKVIAASQSPLQKLQADEQKLIRAQRFMAARGGIEMMRGEGEIGPGMGDVDLLGDNRMAQSRAKNPALHRFGDDLGMGIQQSVEGALQAAFTGGSTRAIVDQFSIMLQEAVIGALAASISEQVGAVLMEQIADIAMSIGGGAPKAGGAP